ncbi:MAG: FxsA family protein [Actinomycetes bacterium]
MSLLLFVLLVAWPVTEVYVATLVAAQIGWGSTLLLILMLSLLGLWVMRSTVRRTRTAMAGMDPRQVPPVGSGARAADASLRFLGGLLLFIPGLVSDAVGLMLLVPPIRTVVIALVGQTVVRRYAGSATVTRVRLWTGGDVIQGEVVDPPGDTPPGSPNGPPQLPPGR